MEPSPASVDQIRWVFRFHDWARPRLVAAAWTLDEPQRRKPGVVAGGNGDGSVHDALCHVLGAEVTWFARWQGDAHHSLWQASEYPDLDTLDAAWAALEDRRCSWLEGLTDADLTRPVGYMSARLHVMEQFPLWETLLHVCNHTAHHRGEVSAALTGLGTPPETLDLIDYMRALRDGFA
jgi:uncharacterized damage-inducible protein DinB